MGLTTQASINLLNGSLAAAWNDGRPGGSNRLIPSIPGNALEHPTLDVAESNPPFGSQFAGVTYFDDWGQLSQLYTNTVDTQTFVGNKFLANFPAFKDLGGTLDDQPKVLKLFGAGTDFSVTSGNNSNNNNSRTYTGVDSSNRIPLVGMSESTTIGSFPDSTCWCRNEWSQSVDIPDSATKVTFGAYMRVPENDEFRAKNCGGVYIAQWANLTYPTYYVVNAITVKRDADSFSFLSGTQSQGLISQQQWSGLRPDFKTSGDKRRWNDTTNIQSVDYRSTDDHRQFRKVEKEVTLQSGTSRKMVFSCFFGENQANIDETDTPTGSIHFYQPFVIFS